MFDEGGRGSEAPSFYPGGEGDGFVEHVELVVPFVQLVELPVEFVQLFVGEEDTVTLVQLVPLVQLLSGVEPLVQLFEGPELLVQLFGGGTVPLLEVLLDQLLGGDDPFVLLLDDEGTVLLV